MIDFLLGSFVCVVCLCVCLCVSLRWIHLFRFGQLLRCVYKRIVNIIKVCIDKNNM